MMTFPVLLGPRLMFITQCHRCPLLIFLFVYSCDKSKWMKPANLTKLRVFEKIKAAVTSTPALMSGLSSQQSTPIIIDVVAETTFLAEPCIDPRSSSPMSFF